MSVNRGKPQDIKKLMQEQLKTKAGTRQVDSPYAKYNSRGQLVCVVCGVVVKSAIIWQAHVSKRSHLDSLAKLKNKQHQLNSQSQSRGSSSKQKSSSSSSSSSSGQQKRPSSPHQHQPPVKKPTTDTYKPKGILKKVATYSSSDDSDDDDDSPPPITTTHIKTEDEDSPQTTNGLPEGFFDSEENDGARVKKEKEEDGGGATDTIYKDPPKPPKDPPKPNTTQILPEGFFDDPKADAKARNVEYKDKDAEEWMSFMKEVSAAEQESRTIIEEDKEEAALTTQIEQASEQIAFLERVVTLDKEKETQLRERGGGRGDSGDSQDSSDEEFAPVIWRTKNSLI